MLERIIAHHDFNTTVSDLDVSLELYIMQGINPGGFLTSVIANDLFRAVGCIHPSAKDRFVMIVDEVRFKCPASSIGSYEIFSRWIYDVNSVRTKYTERIEKQFTFDTLKGVKPKTYADYRF